MAELWRFENNGQYAAYMTPEMGRRLSNIAPHLANFVQHNVVIFDRTDVLGTADEPGRAPAHELTENFNKISEFFDSENIVLLEGESDRLKTLEYVRDFFEMSGNYAAIATDTEVNAKPAYIILMDEAEINVPKTMELMSGLSRINESPALQATDPQTVLAFILGHEAGHNVAEKENGEVSQLGKTAGEVAADRHGFAFCEYLKNQGFPISDKTLDTLRHIRTLSMLHIIPEEAGGYIIGDNSLAEVLGDYKNSSHATGLFLREGEAVSFDVNKIGEFSASVQNSIYMIVGDLYRGEYEELIATNPDAAIFVDDKMNLTWMYKPGDPQAVLDKDGLLDPDDDDLMLGYWISQNHPEVHFAVVQSLLETGLVTENNPEEKAILEAYTESFRALMPERIDPSLRAKLDAEIGLIKEAREARLAVEENPESILAPRPPGPGN